jgi:hypothetical protein
VSGWIWVLGVARASLMCCDGEQVGEFLRKQMVPRAIGCMLEEFQLQAIALFAAHLGTTDLATHNALVMVFFVITSAMYGRFIIGSDGVYWRTFVCVVGTG